MISIYQEIFDRSPVAMLLVDESSSIQIINKHAAELFEYSEGELVGRDISVLVPENTRKKHPGLVKGFFSSPLPRQMGVGRNLYGVKKDHSQFPVEVGLNPIQAEDKFYVMASVIDITERIRAEERFKIAVDAAPNGMLMVSKQGVIELINKATEEIFGYDREELIGEKIEMLVPQEFRVPHPNFIKSYINKPEPRSMGIGRELFGKHKSGRLIPLEIGLRPIVFEDDTYVISSIVDITERRNAEKELEMKNQEIQEFSYRTSHDLKSPLLTIEGLAEFVHQDITNGKIEPAAEGISRIKTLTKKLNRLVEDILILTKADLSNEEASVFDFNQYAIDAKEKFEILLDKNSVRLETVFAQNKSLVTQNTRLTQVLDNLISNSIKYSKEGNESHYVRLNVFNDAQKFYIQVEDNGIGIPKEKHQEVFGMFKRFDQRDVAGSGLGLYMIKKHMQKLGANINFESNPKGTIFYIEFLINESLN